MTYSATGPLEWTVIEVDEERAVAKVVSVVMTRRQERELPLAELKVVDSLSNRHRPRDASAGYQGYPRVNASKPREKAPRRSHRLHAVDGGVPLLDRILECIVFSPECLEQYRREFEPDVPWRDIAKRLHREVRNHGRLVRRGHREYVRIRTPRFDIPIARRPTGTEAIVVTTLQPSRSWRGVRPKAA